MYCTNCGLQLPDWAHFCERCGARVQRIAADDDPLDHVGLDDTSAHEPLWPAHSRGDNTDGQDAASEAQDERLEDVDLQTLPLKREDILGEAAAEEVSEASQPVPDEDEAADLEHEATDIEHVEESDELDDVAPEDEAEEASAAAIEESDAEAASYDELADDEAKGEDDVPASDDASDAEPVDADEAEGDATDDTDQDASSGHQTSGMTERMSTEEFEALQASADESESDEAPAEDEAAAEAEEAEPEPELHNYIDVGEQDGPLMVDSPIRHRVPDAWQGRQRPSERRAAEPSMSMKALAIAAAAAIVLGFIVAFAVLGSGASTPDQGGSGTVTHKISKSEATAAIETLDGWWTTDRALDSRVWHIQGGLMETYAADGQLAKQELLDASYVERMDVGPGGIEGEGYYFRDIAFYLLDSDSNTLHAINGDGSADEDANLFRTDPPAFMSGGSSETTQPAKPEKADASEYVLPESNVRAYDTSELESLSDHDLFLARNEIYARHGYVFEAGELSEYFSSKSWYHPTDVFNEGDISEIERQNVSTILALEHERGSQYA